MLLGYNTNGLAHHRLTDAIEVLASIGYQSVALTLDHGALNPYAAELQAQLRSVRSLLSRHAMRSVVETGARFLLDPWTKHEPTLMSPSAEARNRRIDFLCRAVDVARELQSDCVSIWSGAARDRPDEETALERLAGGLRRVLDHAASREVVIAFEPEPGMFVDTMSRYQRLLHWIDAPHLMLTLDVGHLYCQGEVPLADYIAAWSSRLANVHLEDMRAGVHEHLMFGEGEMDFPPIIQALAASGYQGGVHVELSRHSHLGPQAARQAYEFLKPLFDTGEPS